MMNINQVDEVDWSVTRLPRGVVLNVAGVGWRPFEKPEEVFPDLDRLIKSIIAGSTDHSNVNLQFEELYGELQNKLVQVVNRRDVSFDCRESFFGFAKVSLIRHLKSTIQKYAFTFKRTGVKPPKRGEKPETDGSGPRFEFPQEEPEEHHKITRLELDNDESGVGNMIGEEVDHERMQIREDMSHFISQYLTPIEAMVIRQEIEPNSGAMVYSYIDSKEGKHVGKFKITDAHKAAGLGLEPVAYKRALLRVKDKIKLNWKQHMNDEVTDVQVAENRLCEIFNLQVPSSIDSTIKRRLFTIAARDNNDKVTDEVAQLLQTVGAYVPKQYGDTQSCFGILWESNHRICSVCCVEQTCATKAKNIGLDTIKLSPRLLGTKLTKMPIILPKVEPSPTGIVDPATSLTVHAKSDRDEELLNFLNESLRPVLHRDEIYYRLLDAPNGQSVFAFCVGAPERMMSLRFVNPLPELQKRLRKEERSWVLPEELLVKESIVLINEHIANIVK
jgi:hypothetical protein